MVLTQETNHFFSTLADKPTGFDMIDPNLPVAASDGDFVALDLSGYRPFVRRLIDALNEGICA